MKTKIKIRLKAEYTHKKQPHPRILILIKTVSMNTSMTQLLDQAPISKSLKFQSQELVSQQPASAQAPDLKPGQKDRKILQRRA